MPYAEKIAKGQDQHEATGIIRDFELVFRQRLIGIEIFKDDPCNLCRIDPRMREVPEASSLEIRDDVGSKTNVQMILRHVFPPLGVRSLIDMLKFICIAMQASGLGYHHKSRRSDLVRHESA